MSRRRKQRKPVHLAHLSTDSTFHTGLQVKMPGTERGHSLKRSPEYLCGSNCPRLFRTWRTANRTRCEGVCWSSVSFGNWNSWSELLTTFPFSGYQFVPFCFLDFVGGLGFGCLCLYLSCCARTASTDFQLGSRFSEGPTKSSPLRCQPSCSWVFSRATLGPQGCSKKLPAKP